MKVKDVIKLLCERDPDEQFVMLREGLDKDGYERFYTPADDIHGTAWVRNKGKAFVLFIERSTDEYSPAPRR